MLDRMSRLIDCFKKHNIPGLKDKYESQIKDGMSDAEKLNIATQIALEHHKELHDDLNKLRTEVGVDAIEYISPSKEERVKAIQEKFNKEIDAKKTQLAEENKKRESEKPVEAPKAVVSDNKPNPVQNGQGNKKEEKGKNVLVTPSTSEDLGATEVAPTLFIDGKKNTNSDIEDIATELQDNKIDVNKQNIIANIDENISTIREVLSDPNISTSQEKDAYKALNELTKLRKKVDKGTEYKIQSETTKTKKENANKEREIPENNKPEYKNGDGTRKATETSNSNSTEQSRKEPPKEKEVTPEGGSNISEFKRGDIIERGEGEDYQKYVILGNSKGETTGVVKLGVISSDPRKDGYIEEMNAENNGGFRKVESTKEVEQSPLEKLEKEYEDKTIPELSAIKKKLYGNVDIESPMSPEEKLLNSVIAKKLSVENQRVMEKRKAEEAKPTVITNVKDFKKALKEAIPSLGKKQLETLAIQAEQLKNFTVKEFGLSEEEAWKATQGEIVKSLEELGSNALSQNPNQPLNLQNIINYAKSIITGTEVFKRFSQDEQRGLAKGGEIHAESSIILGANGSANEQAESTNEEQENQIEKYAKERGVWIEDVNEKYGPPDNAGEESIVWVNPENQTVTKSQNTFLYSALQEKLDSITLHNSLFPEAAIKVIGFGRNVDGDFQVIIEQPFIVADETQKVTPSQIKEYMAKLGFENTEGTNYSNSQTIIEDLHTGNAILTPEGNIVIIDPIARLNTPDQGYGGKRKIGTGNVNQEQGGEIKGAANTQTQQTFYDKLADISTAIHEPSHLFLGLIDTLASQGNSKAIAMQRTINQWTESKEGIAFAEREGLEMNSPVHRQELFARSAEKYFMEGKRAGFSERMNKVFEAFETFLKDVYKGVVNSPFKIQLSPEIRDLFDTIYGKEKTNEDLGKSTLSKREAIKEIKSKPLSIVKGLGMGMNSADGTYISTEPVNRYATKENPGIEVKKVDIKNPLVVTNDTGLLGMRTEVLNNNISEFTTEDFELGTKMNGIKHEDDLSAQGRSKLSTMITDSLKKQGYDSIYFPQSDTQEGELIVFNRDAITLGKQLLSPVEQAKKKAAKPRSNNAAGRKYLRENADTSLLGANEPKGLFMQLLLNGRFLIKSDSLKKLYADTKTSSGYVENEEYALRKWMTESYFSNFRNQAKAQNTELISTDNAAEIIHSELGDKFSIQEIRNQIEEAIHENESRANYYATYEDMMEKAKGNEVVESEFKDEEIAEMIAHKQKMDDILVQQAIEMNNENTVPISDEALAAMYDKYVTDGQISEQAFIDLSQNIINQLNQYVNEKANQNARGINAISEGQSNEDNPGSPSIEQGQEDDGIFFQKPGEKESLKDLLKRVKEIKIELKDMKSEADLSLDEIKNFKLIRGEDVGVQGVETYADKLGRPDLVEAYKKEFKQKESLGEMMGLLGDYLAKGGKINEVAKLLGDEKIPLTNRVLIGSAIKGLTEGGFISKQTSDAIFTKYTKQLGTDVSEALNAFRGTDEAPSPVVQSLIYSAIGQNFEKELETLNNTLDEINNGAFKDEELIISESKVAELKNEVEVLKNKLAEEKPVVAETVNGTRRKKASDKLELIKNKLKDKYGDGFLKELSDKINKIKC